MFEDKIQIRDLTSLAKKKCIPISVLIEVCYKCNEQCVHCFLENHFTRGLSLAQHKLLLDQLVQAGTFFIIYSGGEPFIRDDFLNIVEEARKRRISVTIFTNGTLINKAIAESLNYLSINEVHISLYSAKPDIHDSITRIPGSFLKSICAIKLLKSNNVSVRIKTPLMKHTVNNYNELLSLAHSLNTEIQFTTVITAKNNGDVSTINYRINDDQLRDIITDTNIFEYSNTRVSYTDYLDCIPCDAVFNAGAIDPLGDVYVCNQLRVKVGNVLEKHFQDIWQNSEPLNHLRQIKLKDLHECKECTVFQFCSRCPGLALLEDGDIYGCSSSAKIIAEERMHHNLYPKQSHIFSEL